MHDDLAAGRSGRLGGELPRDPLVRFPQIIGQPVVLTLLWTRLFEKFAPLEYRQVTRACLDLIFHGPCTKGRPA